MAISLGGFSGGGSGSVTGGLVYKGAFNATAGTPSIANARQGDFYVIDTAGTIYGQTWSINDHLLINADMGGSVTNSKIDKIDNTEPTNVLITTNNLSDLNSASTARTNLGLGTAATVDTGTSNGNVVVLDATGLPAVDGSQLTNVTSTDASKLAIANNLSDLNSASTARTNLGLGTAATANTGTSNGNVVVLDATGLPAVDGSQLTNVTSTDSSKLAIANNLSDLNNVGTARTNLGLGTAATSASTDFLQVSNNLSDVTAATARTNLGLGTAATANTGTSNGNVVVLDATGLPAVDGSQLTNVTSTDSSKLAIANNLSDLNNVGTARTNLGLGTAATAASTDFLQVSNNLSDVTAATARTNLGLGTAATANTGTSNGNVVVLDATGLPAVDGSQLTNVTSTDSSKLAIANNLSDLNNAGTARTNLGLGTAATAASTDFLSGTGADTLGGNLDVGTSDIVSSSNNNIEFAADGTGVVKVIPTATGGHLELNGDGTNVGKLRLMCEQSSHGIYLTGPSHSASASYTLKFPDTAGTNNYVLKTDGSGNLDWVAQSGGGFTYSAITGDPNPAVANYHYSCTGTFSITLPAASSLTAGEEIRIKNMGSGTITINRSGSDTIDGQASYTLDVEFSAVTLVSSGSANTYEVI